MGTLNFIFLIFVIFHLQFSHQDDNKYKVQMDRLSIFTPYQMVENKDVKPLDTSTCQPIKVWGLIRQGISSPPKEMSDRMRSKLKSFYETYKTNHPDLQDWKMEDNEPIDQLVDRGKKEMNELGQRIRSRFGEFFTDYSKLNYRFNSSLSQSTHESMIEFAKGLFGKEISEIGSLSPTDEQDLILRPYLHCPSWKANVEQSEELKQALGNKTESDRKSFLFDVTVKVGILDPDISYLQLFYERCAYETIWGTESSLWCALISPNSFKLAETMQDLTDYFLHGAKYDINNELTCLLISDLHKFITNSDTPKVAFHFTDSSTMLHFYTALKLFQDKTQISLSDLTTDRNWRTSKIDTFGSNIMFALMECEEKRQVVKVFHQERSITLADCKDKDGCSLDEFKNKFKKETEECDFNKVCNVPKSQDVPISPGNHIEPKDDKRNEPSSAHILHPIFAFVFTFFLLSYLC